MLGLDAADPTLTLDNDTRRHDDSPLIRIFMRVSRSGHSTANRLNHQADEVVGAEEDGKGLGRKGAVSHAKNGLSVCVRAASYNNNVTHPVN